jgi:hypothetical protein
MKTKKEREKWKDDADKYGRNNLKGLFGRLNTLGKMFSVFI